MSDWFKIDRQAEELLTDIQGFLKSVLELDGIKGVLVPRRLPMKNTVMPALVSSPEFLDAADPLAPAFTVNSAKNLSRLTRKGLDANIAAVMRSCEIRAFVELVKLHQSEREPVILIGMDCLGALTNRSYPKFAAENPENSSDAFRKARLEGNDPADPAVMNSACRICEHPVPEAADIIIGLYGVDLASGLFLQAKTARGREILEKIGASPAQAPKDRAEVVQKLIDERIAARDQVFEETAEAVSSIEKLAAYLADCVNCYNCRVACPACYCRECVFTTDVFDHDPMQYLHWADRRGALKMPTDTVFYHITRLTHMSTACVGCGQCSNACPNDIPLTELFRTVSHRTQAAFDYEAGRSTEESPPLLVFKEDEFSEIVGIGK